MSKSKGWWAANGALLLPLLLVNAAAIYGQVGWAHEHLLIDGRPLWAVAILFALALESVGFYLAAEAHSAAIANQSSSRLRWASYAVAVLVGALNYAHFADPGLKPNAVALAFGGLSVISPWLWAIRSRSMSRTQLLAAGLLDARAVKFTAAQWVLYPRRTFRAFRAAVWVGETDPARARALIDSVPAAPAAVESLPLDDTVITLPSPSRVAAGLRASMRARRRPARLAGRPRTSKPATPPTPPLPAPASAVAALTAAPAATTQPITKPHATKKKPRGRRTGGKDTDQEAFRYWEQNRNTSARELAARFPYSVATAARRINEWKDRIPA